jgi:hypothetical protein
MAHTAIGLRTAAEEDTVVVCSEGYGGVPAGRALLRRNADTTVAV